MEECSAHLHWCCCCFRRHRLERAAVVAGVQTNSIPLEAVTVWLRKTGKGSAGFPIVLRRDKCRALSARRCLAPALAACIPVASVLLGMMQLPGA